MRADDQLKQVLPGLKVILAPAGRGGAGEGATEQKLLAFCWPDSKANDVGHMDVTAALQHRDFTQCVHFGTGSSAFPPFLLPCNMPDAFLLSPRQPSTPSSSGSTNINLTFETLRATPRRRNAHGDALLPYHRRPITHLIPVVLFSGMKFLGSADVTKATAVLVVPGTGLCLKITRHCTT